MRCQPEFVLCHAGTGAAVKVIFVYILLLGLLAGCPPAGDGAGSSDSAEPSETSSGSSTSGDPTTTTTTATTAELSTDLPEPPPACGNGIVEPGESCDEGEDNGDTRDCTSTCAHAVCGDGLVRSEPSNPGDVEGCDAGEANQDGMYGGCQTDCTPGPFCGDGVVDDGFEECEPTVDDGGPACMQDCFYEGRVVFVSSVAFAGNFTNFVVEGTGLDGGDEACRQLASLAELSRPESFHAWLGSADGSPVDRISPKIHDASAHVRLVDGTIVAMDWPSFVSSTHDHAIDLDETGEPVDNELVWTGVDVSGQANEYACHAWSSDLAEEIGAFGCTAYADERWTEFGYDFCSYMFRLYCIQTAMPGDMGF